MAFSRSFGLGVAVALLVGCPSDPEQGDGDGGSSSSGGEQSDITVATLPIPTTVGMDTGDDTTGGSDGSSGGTTAGVTTGEPETGDSTSNGTTSDDSSDSSTTDPTEDTGEPSYDIGWCILQFPATVSEDEGNSFTVYIRVFAEGLTDQTGVNDPDPLLVVEVGYGDDGSDPSMGDMWTYSDASPNDGYGPGAPDYSEVNDEYQGDLSINSAGIYDFAGRVSGDGGKTWVWCDLDGLTTGGYTPDQAGEAEIGQ